MTTTVLDRVPVDRITEQARQARPGRTLLTLIAGALFGIGWLAAKAFAVVWLAGTWSWTAVGVGWQSAHGPSRGQQITALSAEVQALRDQVKRLGG